MSQRENRKSCHSDQLHNVRFVSQADTMDCINRHLAAVTTAAKTSVPAIDPRAEYQNSLDAYQACINSNLQNAEACEDKRVQMETNERAYRNR
jgi:hypothetical protein